MADALSWIEVPGAPYQLSQPVCSGDGEWSVNGRYAIPGGDWLLWKRYVAPTAGSAIFRAVEGMEADQRDAAATIAAGARLTTEPTPAGLQYVMPGCEKDRSRGPRQLDLF